MRWGVYTQTAACTTTGNAVTMFGIGMKTPIASRDVGDWCSGTPACSPTGKNAAFDAQLWGRAA